MPIGIGTIVAGGAALLGAGATIIASDKASHAQTNAANTAAATEQNVANQNNQLARDMYDKNAARLDPYSQMGLAAGDQYMGILLGPASGHSSSGWAPVPGTAPNNALAPVVTPTPAPTTSALGSVVQQHAAQAIAAGANPASVAQRAAQYGVTV